MKRSIRKTGLVFGAILATITLISSATAVPQTNSETVLEVIDAEELNIKELIGYYADLFGVKIDSEEEQFLNIGSQVVYYSVSSEEISDFLKVFFQSDIVFNYWMSNEFNNLALSIRSMITDCSDYQQVANDIITIIDSPEFDELVQDMQNLLQSEEFGEYDFLEQFAELLCELASLTALVILILLFPIEWLGYNPLTQIIVFPIAAILAIPMAIVLGIAGGVVEASVEFLEMLEDFVNDLYDFLQSIPNDAYNGFKKIFAFIVIPIGIVMLAIFCMCIYMPILIIADTLVLELVILAYLDEYWQELMDELLPGLNLTSTTQTQPSTPVSNPTNV